MSLSPILIFFNFWLKDWIYIDLERKLLVIQFSQIWSFSWSPFGKKKHVSSLFFVIPRPVLSLHNMYLFVLVKQLRVNLLQNGTNLWYYPCLSSFKARVRPPLPFLVIRERFDCFETYHILIF